MAERTIPNTFIAGFPRSGTSSLWYWLSEHPDVCGSGKKETYFLFDEVMNLNKDANIHEHGWEGYQHLFNHCKGEHIKVEATPVYFNRQTPLAKIPEINPLPKVIFMVRDPVQRIFSFYRFQKYRQKNIPKHKDFETFLAERPNLIANNQYIKQIRPWIDKMGAGHVEVFLMEEMLKDSKTFMQKVCEYLGIDPEFYDYYHFPVGNPSVQVRFQWLHQLGLKIRGFLPTAIQSKVLNPLYMKLNTQPLPQPTYKELATKEQLKEQFEPYNKELAKIFNLDLSYWKGR